MSNLPFNATMVLDSTWIYGCAPWWHLGGGYLDTKKRWSQYEKEGLSEGLRHLGFVVMLVLCLVVSGEAYGYAQESGGEPLPLFALWDNCPDLGYGQCRCGYSRGVERACITILRD